MSSTLPGTKLPGIVKRARLGVEMLGAKLVYRDVKMGLDSKVEDLNLRVEDISLTHPMKIVLWADLDTKLGETLLVQGPARMEGQVAPTFENTDFVKASIALKVDLNKLMIKSGDLFEKTKDVMAEAQAEMSVDTKSAQIQKLEIRFHNAQLNLGGSIDGLDQMAKGGELSHSIKVASNEIAFEPWTKLVPMLKEFDLSGSASLKAQSEGMLTDPRYRADVWVKGLTAASPMLKNKPEINGEVHVMTDQVKSLVVAMKAPGNDLRINGSLVSFTKPKFDFSLLSPSYFPKSAFRVFFSFSRF